MAERDLSVAGPFHELRGDYVDHAGQQINLHGYLDYFEPLGSSLARLPDGAGGPFVYRFTPGGGATIGALGWVVSAASRRYGAWKLWGMWSDRDMPAIALPLFWPELADGSRTAGIVERANGDVERLFDRKQWIELCEEIDPTRLRNAGFREILKAELSHAWAVPPPYRQPIEIELTPTMLDLLPWIWILGPVAPTEAQLQPCRFNGGGYQYILSDRGPAERDAEIPADIDELVDAAADDVAGGWKKANVLRARRAKAAAAPAPPPRETRRWEEPAMPARKPPAPRPALPLERWTKIWTVVFQVAVLALLFWIALELRAIRNAKPSAAAPAPAVTTTTTTTAANVVPPEAPPSAAAPVEAPETPAARVERIAHALATSPPQGIRVTRAPIAGSTSLARAAVEVFLRQNGCFSRSEVVDGKISASEEKAMRNCTALHAQRLVNSRGEIDEGRAIAWLERTVS